MSSMKKATLGILFVFITFCTEAFVTKSVSHIVTNRVDIAMKKSSQPSDDNAEGKIEAKTWNPLRLAVLKLGMTEPAWTSPWNYQKKEGTFSCAYCGQDLFDSNAKYDSGSGWPSFWRTSSDGLVALKREWDGRVECVCSKCDSHLGHVFMDGPVQTSLPSELVETILETDLKSAKNPSRLPRYCINGASLRFDEKKVQ